MSDVVNNESLKRYELKIDGEIAFAEYRIQDGVMYFVHTLVPRKLEGRGVGTKLAHGALTQAKAAGYAIAPRCSFIEHYVEKHPEFLA